MRRTESMLVVASLTEFAYVHGMSLWRKPVPMVCCALMLLIAAGCSSAPGSPLDEEKEPFVVQGQRREASLDYARAIESYHRALEINPGNGVAHYRLGLLYEKDDRNPAAAIYHFQRFLVLRPNSEQAPALNQRIIGCKQALAKEVALGPISDEMQGQLEELVRTNHQLREENQRLTQENQELKAMATVNSVPSTPRATDTASTRSPTPSPAPESRPRGSTTHTVKRGDTYYSIATRYGVSAASLERANPGVDPRQLRIGQQVIVPTR